MTQKLDPLSREALISYRIEKCETALREASLLAENGFYDNAVTRLYYACFYMASALLIKNEIQTGSHKAVKTMLSLKFVKNGELDSKHIKTYTDLLNGRQLSDYEDFYRQDEESYTFYAIRPNEFIDSIKNLIYRN